MQSLNLAPIAFFAYKRPEHTLKALTSLSQCKLAQQSILYIFCDAAKFTQDREPVQQVREVVRSQQWCGKVEIIYRESNFGLAQSIISATTSLCKQHGRVIVLEDDLIVSPYFLKYMNDALNLYESEAKVMQISGHMFPFDIKQSETDAIFLPLTTTWGWATWDRAWKQFNSGITGYQQLKKNPQLRRKFDLDGSYPYFRMLQQKIKGKVDSWGIDWYLTVFRAEGLSLFPIKSLVANIGFDGSGTNCGYSHIQTKEYFVRLEKEQVEYRYPSLIKESIYKEKIFNTILLETRQPNVFLKILHKAWKISNKFKLSL
ncbi:hypothetical protein NG796_09910 [Laspinema sp. A4]|uniref:hypothetical protein n=1 Tax=Laspinema sp. D2d TaxID=2953686 RepID=UPI0021BB7288|nr:hypothetical protein [Laspinema sp. D2d]MCT7983612.1 hypothetical protein [Laspinema sp. D2d]